MRKQAFVQAYNEVTGLPASTHVRINGMVAVPGEPGMFEIQGVSPRVINHVHLENAVDGYTPELGDVILEAIWKYDIVRLLTERMVTKV